jgi:hypothetical protein
MLSLALCRYRNKTCRVCLIFQLLNAWKMECSFFTNSKLHGLCSGIIQVTILPQFSNINIWMKDPTQLESANANVFHFSTLLTLQAS